MSAERISDALLLSGSIIFLMGIYYFAIKGSIPYQDPTLEMQIKYAIIIGTGSVLMRNGVLAGALGLALRAGMAIHRKNTDSKEEEL